MSRGACVDHVDVGGFTAIVSLWYHRDFLFSRAEFLKAMLEFSPLPIHSEDDEYWNPAYQTAMQGSANEMELMIELGADVYELDDRGGNIMEYCARGCNMETFDYLLDQMPDRWFERRDLQGRTALHHVFQQPNAFACEMATCLINLGADIHARDNEGLTVSNIAQQTDITHKDCVVWRSGMCRNLYAWQKTLHAVGIEVDCDDEGDVFWSATSILE